MPNVEIKEEVNQEEEDFESSILVVAYYDVLDRKNVL